VSRLQTDKGSRGVRRPAPTMVICLSFNRGGMELDTLKLAELLCGHTQVTLVCKAGTFLHREAQVRLGDRVRYLPIVFRSRTFSPAIVVAMARTFRRDGTRNAIFFGASELKSLSLVFRHFRLNVIVRHGTTKTTPKDDWLHRWIYTSISHHVAISQHLKHNVEKIIPCGKAPVHVIYPSFALEIPAARPTPSQAQVARIVHVGRVVPGKGQLEAIRACAVLAQAGHGFELSLIGGLDEPAYAQRVAAAIEALPDPAAVKVTGHTSTPRAHIEQADIFLFPSHGEGFGNALLEALSTGLIAITYDNTAFPELADLGLRFHMAEDRNEQHLSEVLLAVTRDLPGEKERCRANMDLIRKKFAPARELAQWLALLE